MSTDAPTDVATDAPTGTTSTLTLTETAAEKVQSFLADADEQGEVALRVAVQAGGCAGFRYALFFDDRALDGDLVEQQHGVTIRVDAMSQPYLGGAVIDWKESLEASGFSIENPNASGSCACGESATF
ncbi:MAG: HesB/IscA family protein [Actinomycetes bacterium]